MMIKIDLTFILGSYRKYLNDLKKVGEFQRKQYSSRYRIKYEKHFVYRALNYSFRKIGIPLLKHNRKVMWPQLDDVEAEITYLLIREFEPENIVEISPGGGWSTLWILNAIKDNGVGYLYSYDLIDDSTKIIPQDLSQGRWRFIHGDVKKMMEKLPNKIDYLFIDSDHSSYFAWWYIQNIFPKLRSGTPVSVHDVFHTVDPSSFGGEGGVIINWLNKKGIQFFTAAPAKEKNVYRKIMLTKKKLNILKPIHYGKANPMIFFIFEECITRVANSDSVALS